MTVRKACANLNHGRSLVSISFCPQCGEKFKPYAQSSCNDEKHRTRRKDRHIFCVDCGKNLKIGD